MSYEAVKQWRSLAKRKMVLAFGGACACCGLRDDDCVYDFHHLNPKDKDGDISRRIRAWDKVVEEAQKCVMLCVICHRKVHGGLIAVPTLAPKFDVTLIPEFVTLKGEPVHDECPVCGKPKRSKRKFCSITCAGRAVGYSRKGTTMPYSWSRRKVNR